MKMTEYHTIGVMSGTSLDGVDLCYVKFRIEKDWQYEILHSETIEYSHNWTNSLRNAISLSQEELSLLDTEYSSYLFESISKFIKRNKITHIDLVCSHGHTVFHQPDKGLTYQLGNRLELKSNLICPVICDFRVQDVKFGGQGAPLVPIGDRLLFKQYDYCLNLGGFANVSFEKDANRIAYDICPVNIVMNHYVNELGYDYDDNGDIARGGFINKDLLDKLNELPFYKKVYPKSLGLEWVQNEVFPLIDSYNLSIKDVLRTMIEHIAIQIQINIRDISKLKILVTGGGAYNGFLIERLKDLSTNEIVIPEDKLIDYKEALIFAFLGVLKSRNEVNCLSSVTGASHDHSSGIIYT